MPELPEPIQNITSQMRLKKYPRGQIIYYQGDELAEVLVIKTGVVKIYDIDNQGNEKILHLARSPAVIPYAFFSGGSTPPKWFYSALTDCQLYVIGNDVLKKLLAQDFELTNSLINQFSTDVHELLVRLSSLGKSKASYKLDAVLKFLLVRHAKQVENGWFRVRFMINHQLMADIAGITRERTAVIMKRLQDRGVIRNPKQNILEINQPMLVKKARRHP